MKIKCSALIMLGYFGDFILLSFVSYNVGVLVPEGGDGVSNQAPSHATPTDLQ